MNATTRIPTLRRLVMLGLLFSAALFAHASAAPATEAATLCATQGPGAGQCDRQQGIAVNQASGDVYIAERENHRVSVFASSGAFLFAFGWDVVPGGGTGFEKCTTASGCKAGSPGAGAGQFNRPTRIAIDNTGGAEQGKVYVGTDSQRVQKFNPDGAFASAFGTAGEGECEISRANAPIAIGPGGEVFVADSSGSEPNFTSRVQRYSPAGACLGETVLIEGNAVLKALAIDADEDAWVSVDRVSDALRKYDLGAAGPPLCSPTPAIGTNTSTNALAIGAEGSLLASQREPKAVPPGIRQVITKYDAASCAPLQRFGYEAIASNLAGLAPYAGAAGDVFASEDDSDGVIHHLTIPPLGPIVVPSSLSSDVRSVRATLSAEVNPEGVETTVVVDAVDDASFDAEGGFESPNTITGPPAVLAAGFDVKAVSALVGCPIASEAAIEAGECLEPDTEYHFRVRATNADNTTGAGEGTVEGAFTTKPPIEVGDVYATGVGTDAARINAEVNPLGTPSSGYFEYVTEAEYLQSGFAGATQAPDVKGGAGPIDFGSGEEAITRSVTLSPLQPGTAYRYRLLGDNVFVEGELASEGRSFATFRPAAPDSCPNDAFRLGAAALLPDCRAYEMVSPLDKASGDIKVLKEDLTKLPATLDQAAASGSKLVYGAYRSFGDAPSAPQTSQYLAARTGGGWQSHAITPPRGKPIVESVAVQADTELRFFSEDLCQGWIVPLAGPTLAPGANDGYRNLYRRSDRLCGAESYEALSNAAPESLPPNNNAFQLELQGVAADGSIAAFAATDSLMGSGAPANPTGKVQLYVRGPGQGPRFACILPGGAPAETACSAGSGSTVGFGRNRSASVQNALSADGSRLYWSDSATQGKIYLRQNPLAAGAECIGAGSPCAIAVSADAEALSKTTKSQFLAAARDGSAALFSTADAGKGVSDLYSFEVEDGTSSLVAHKFLGLLGASADATKVYFASTEALAAGAEAGKANLYRYDAAGGGGYRLVGVLAAADLDPGFSSPVAELPTRHNGRVSPTGDHAAFMSAAPLTGYDNKDAASGEADREVFLYDASANGGEGELLCASCNPSGARPEGENAGSESFPFWVAAQIPAYENTLYAPRVLADDGSRLYFESADALVARDSNGRIDVYQWERVGKGGCDAADPGFSEASGGCVELISSGESGRDSRFVDASPTGEDVFFTTLASLYPSDYGLADIYDARTGGGFPAPDPGSPECAGESCQSPAAAPPLRTPSTASYAGPGNLAPEAARKQRRARCPKGSRRARGKGKARCVKRRGASAKTRQGKSKRDRRTHR